MNINELIKKELDNISTDAMFQELLKKQINETLSRSLKDALGSYSTLSKSFDKLVEEQLKIKLDNLSLAQYSNFVVDQCELVLKEIMSEQRAEVIRKAFRDRLAPHLVDIVEFGDLIDAITDSLKESIRDDMKEGCCTDTPVYKILCTMDESKYTTLGEQWTLKIISGEGARLSDEIAVLHISGNKCYHSRGDKHNEFTKRFASYVYKNTIVSGIEEVDEQISAEDVVD